MEKPTVFLSHSAKDSELPLCLKKKLEHATGGAIAFFLSSDGESIPFGRNWVGTVQDALSRAKICFVFLTPNSASSSWVYFEAGFVYSKGIRVVPVGFLGIDLGELPPPLGLLQGFNVHSHESLNNIIRILNDEFQTFFQTTFAEKDYVELVPMPALEAGSYFKHCTEAIDKLHLSAKIELSAIPIAREVLAANKLEFHVGTTDHREARMRNSVTTYGMVIRERTEAGQHLELDIDISPDIPESTMRLLDELLAMARAKRPVSLLVEFALGLALLPQPVRISSCLHRESVTMNENGEFLFEGIEFHLAPASRSSSFGVPRGLKIRANGPMLFVSLHRNLNDSGLVNLVALLLRSGVISADPSPDISDWLE